MILKPKSGVKYVELFVGMGKMVAWWHQQALGFSLKGIKEKKGQFGQERTYWLQQGNANILITCALEPAAHDLVSFVDRHGNSIKRFAVEVTNIEKALDHITQCGGVILSNGIEKEIIGEEKASTIRCKLFDDNEIVFIETNSFGPMPGFEQIHTNSYEEKYILGIDHLASVVRVNESQHWNKYLADILSLSHIQTIGEEFFANLMTGMQMNVFSNPVAKINKVIVEPLPNKSKKSQVDTFLKHHFGTGIQHLAFEVDDLISAVETLKKRGVSFTPVPEKYYEAIAIELPDLPLKQLKDSNILCEKEGDKILLQVFTEPIGDRPTLFYEFIQRVNNYDGFGAKNVHQLFKSLEVHLNGSE